jgi:hypothetical protein
MAFREKIDRYILDVLSRHPYGLKRGQLQNQLIRHLREQDPRNIPELEELSKILQRLKQKGLIRPSYKHSPIWSITPKGKNLL